MSVREMKSRMVPVHPKLREALAARLAEPPSRRGADSAALFISGRGGRMTTDATPDVISSITSTAGLDDHVTSHVLRHTFGTEFPPRRRRTCSVRWTWGLTRVRAGS